MNILDYFNIKKYFSSEENTHTPASEEARQARLRKLETELDDDFPRSSAEIEHVYLQPQVMRAILRDCVRQGSS